MKKIGINLVVAVFAFVVGLASASALNKFATEKVVVVVPSVQADAMGNVR